MSIYCKAWRQVELQSQKPGNTAKLFVDYILYCTTSMWAFLSICKTADLDEFDQNIVCREKGLTH